ncbi:MAG: tetratricopeptide repeat protein [Muribaculaceae bacterium]|nr:tetratricopeptide repeat protein [Muribaculaceae bacterium]
MKLNLILSAAILAGSSLLSVAQTHKEGVEYYRADQLSNAKELLQRNYNNAGTDKAVSEYYLGLIALDNNNIAEAQDHFNKGVSLNPDYALNYVGLAEIALRNGDKKGAETFFKDAKSHAGKEKDEKASLDIAIARAYYNVDPTLYAKEIDKNLAQAQKDSPKQGTAYTNADIYLFEGDRKRDLKDFGGAGNQYEMATTYNPNATEAYVKYAELFTQVNPQYAINMLNNLLRVNPQSALGQRELAKAYLNAKDYKNAVAQYEKYVKNPNHFKDDEVQLAYLLFVDGDYQQGYDFATQLLNQNPDNFTAQRFQFLNAANIDALKDQMLPMAEALIAANKAKPDTNKFAQIDYILITPELLSANRPEEAQALVEQAIANDPENPEYYRILATVYTKEKDFVKTAQAYDQYIEKKEKPGYNDIVQQARYNYYAGASQLIDNPELSQQLLNKATDVADQALAISADYPTPYIIKGQAAIALAPTDQDRLSAAVPFYTQAMEIIESSSDPSRYTSDLRDLYTYLGNYYLQDQNDIPSAIPYFEKYVELTPNDQDTKAYIETLKSKVK